MSQQFAVDAEETELSLVIVNHTVSLGGRLDETRSRALLWGLQGPQQVSIHGMDQTRTLCGTHQSTCDVITNDIDTVLTQFYYFTFFINHYHLLHSTQTRKVDKDTVIH